MKERIVLANHKRDMALDNMLFLQSYDEAMLVANKENELLLRFNILIEFIYKEKILKRSIRRKVHVILED